MFQFVHERKIAEAIGKALYEERLVEALRASRADYEVGRYYTTREDLKAAILKKRSESDKG